jgi:hypothetical protein
MDIPGNVKLFEHPIGVLWFDDKGILHSVSRQHPRTIEVMDDYIQFIRNIVNGKKVCILTDISKASAMNKETRNHIGTRLDEVYKAMAILTNTPVGKFIGTSFMHLDHQPYPMAMFTNEQEAYAWLQNYL